MNITVISKLKVTKGFLVLTCLLLFSCCAATKQSEVSVTDQSVTESSVKKEDSSSENMQAAILMTLEKFKEFFHERSINKTTTNFSTPDSTGRQHMTSQEIYNEQSNTKMVEQYREAMDIYVKQLEERISMLDLQVKDLKDITSSSTSEQKNLMDSLSTLIWAVLILIGCLAIIFIILKIKK